MVTQALNTLILEDDEDHARLLELELNRVSELRFEITHCTNSADACDQLESQNFDLVFVDYWLEGETTEGFLDRLREEDAGIPVVVTTGANDEYIAASVIRAGAHRYIRKDDISVPLLRDAIRDAMNDSHLSSRKAVEKREASQRLSLLTPRELEIAKLIAKGLLSKQISAKLGCTEGTVNLHRSHIIQKTQAQSVADVVRLVMVSGHDD